uniref:RasGEF domain family, member 1Bb n=2 Tax=Oncorhynchus kisutch TaxID=8019 RepID=A0A8C7IN92_ONCKI
MDNDVNMPPTTPYAGKFSPYNNDNLHKYHQPMEASYGDMCYHDNSLVSGSLEALIQHLVPTVDYYPDRSYVFTFLLSSRLFLNPYELMSRVCHLCVEQHRSGDLLLDKIRIRDVAPKIVQLLTEWTETFPYDFRDERMMRCLKEMSHHLARGDEYSWRAMQQMTQRLIRRLAALGQYEEAIATLNASAAERPAALKTKQHNGQRSDVLSISDDAFILAQQLTHIELDRLSFIGPEEFIQAFGVKDPLDNHKVGHITLSTTFHITLSTTFHQTLSTTFHITLSTTFHITLSTTFHITLSTTFHITLSTTFHITLSTTFHITLSTTFHITLSTTCHITLSTTFHITLSTTFHITLSTTFHITLSTTCHITLSTTFHITLSTTFHITLSTTCHITLSTTFHITLSTTCHITLSTTFHITLSTTFHITLSTTLYIHHGYHTRQSFIKVTLTCLSPQSFLENARPLTWRPM